ncbi:MAG: beta-galactosidase [Bacteroidetes bacterium]|nr:beta-galactosidase [Bacteroidota bacterium]MBU1114786.1 beta-galactosidase [Bacteroidota bacterium]MBU1797877.1 beta-galactosidase [Bacteroidota bacterium]
MSINKLNGKWKFIKDVSEKLSIFDILAYSENLDKLDDISVPSNWQLEGIENYSGIIWFIKKFDVIEDISNIDFNIIKFNGVDYFADVWLNGTQLGNHEGYFQQFAFEVSKYLKLKDNLLIVKVNSPKEKPGDIWPLKKQLIKGIFNHHDCRPGGWSMERGQDQNTGGIWNDVELILGNKIYVENVKITSNVNENFTKSEIIFEFIVQSNSNFTEIVKVEIAKPDDEIIYFDFNLEVIPGDSKQTYKIVIENPILWWNWEFGEANMYKAKISSVLFEDIYKNFSIKNVKIDEKSNFFINGQKLFLRGTNIIPTQFLSDLSPEKIEKMVSLIREANINIVRVHAHVNRTELYDEFDKQGILVWQDFSLQWTYDESAKFEQNAVNQIKEMVNLLYNHPSISFWCCHNEPGKQIETLDPKLFEAVKSEDNSRIIRLASNYEEHPYDGWYWGKKEHYAATPMGPLVTEFGAQALPSKESLKKFIEKRDLFPPNFDLWTFHNFQPNQTFNIAKVKTGNSLGEFVDNSQNYQAELLTEAVHFYRRKKNNGITGIFQFMFIDCWSSITWSIVDFYFEKKKGFESIKNAFLPILLSINLRQDRYFVEGKLNLDIWVINDTNSVLNEISVLFYLDNEIISEKNNITVNKNDTTFIYFEELDIQIPKSKLAGKYQLKCVLVNETVVLSENEFKIELVNENE